MIAIFFIFVRSDFLFFADCRVALSAISQRCPNLPTTSASSPASHHPPSLDTTTLPSLLRKLLTKDNLRWLFHISCALYFARVLTWHISPESAGRTGRKRFAGYFQFLTVNSLTIQVVQLSAATLVDLTPKVASHQLLIRWLCQGVRLRLKRNADDLSCCVFVLATIVTILFHVIEFLHPGGILVSSSTIVPWINHSTHILNSIVAWTDVIICHPRRFTRRSFGMVMVFSVLYGIWISFIKYKTGVFPYGFLNKLPHPYGLLMMAPVVVLLTAFLFLIGKQLSIWTRHVMRPDAIEDLDAKVESDKGGSKLSDRDEVDALKLD